MEKYDGNETYCSEAEAIPNEYDLGDRNEDYSQTVRRSQRIKQRSSAKKSPFRNLSEEDRGGELSEATPKKPRLQRVRNSSQFRSHEIEDCSQTDARSIATKPQSVLNKTPITSLPSTIPFRGLPPNAKQQSSEFGEITAIENNNPIDLRIGLKRPEVRSDKKVRLSAVQRRGQEKIDIDLCKDNASQEGQISNTVTIYENERDIYSGAKTKDRKLEIKKLSFEKKRRNYVIKSNLKSNIESSTDIDPVNRDLRISTEKYIQKNEASGIQNPRKRVNSLTKNEIEPEIENVKVVKNFRNNTRTPQQPEKQAISKQNTIITTVPKLRGVANSLLPKVYPPHFINQRPPSPVCAVDSPENRNEMQDDIWLTPELSQSFETESEPSSSPSLPESLKGIFESDNLREILNIEKIQYKLNERHVKALAMVLNIREQYFRELLNKIIKLDEHILKKIENAMKTETGHPPGNDLSKSTDMGTFPNEGFIANESNTSPTNSSCVECSQSPKSIKPRHFPSQRCSS